MAATKILIESREKRTCRRCHQRLTDPASISEGIGPICRRLDNRLLARLFVANFDAAMEAYHEVDADKLHPETAEAFRSLERAIDRKRATGNLDLREEVKRLEWILSYEQTKENVDALISVVEQLGYVGLANIMRGEATCAEANISFENGALYLAGPRNKAGQEALKKIPGWRFLAKDKPPRWAVPADQADAFFLAIASYYPNNVGLQEAVNAAKAYVAAGVEASRAPTLPVAPAAHVAPRPAGETWVPPPQKAVVEEFENFLIVKAPFNPAFIGEIKALPYPDRRYDPVMKEWEIAGRQRDAAKALVEKYFPHNAEYKRMS